MIGIRFCPVSAARARGIVAGRAKAENTSSLVRNRLGPNLLSYNAQAFLVDASFGDTAGIGEMFLKSHLEEVHLLLALPKGWPSGSVKGLKARGNFTVDIEWREGKVTHYRITSPEPREVKVRVNGETKTIVSERLQIARKLLSCPRDRKSRNG